jgi:LacI family transcriptional regulator
MNLKTLAQSLGLSETTVSRALNGYPEVSEHTRERVLALARATGYRPNPVARNLALGRTNMIGVVYPLHPVDFGDPMFLEVIAGMTEALSEQDMDLIIAPVRREKKLHAYEQLVQGNRVDGLVVTRTRVHDERISYLTRVQMPFVTYGRTLTDAPYAWFDYDNEAGIRMAAERLLSLGHRRIGFIGASPDLMFARQRLQSFNATMHSAGIAPDPVHIVDNAIDKHAGYKAVMRILSSSAKPSALIVDNHLAGIGVIRALLDQQVAIGSEMSVIVWGSMEESLIDKQVSIISQPSTRLAGEKMIEMILALIDGTPSSELHVLWQPELIPGETVGHYWH